MSKLARIALFVVAALMSAMFTTVSPAVADGTPTTTTTEIPPIVRPSFIVKKKFNKKTKKAVFRVINNDPTITVVFNATQSGRPSHVFKSVTIAPGAAADLKFKKVRAFYAMVYRLDLPAEPADNNLFYYETMFMD